MFFIIKYLYVLFFQRAWRNTWRLIADLILDVQCLEPETHSKWVFGGINELWSYFKRKLLCSKGDLILGWPRFPVCRVWRSPRIKGDRTTCWHPSRFTTSTEIHRRQQNLILSNDILLYASKPDGWDLYLSNLQNENSRTKSKKQWLVILFKYEMNTKDSNIHDVFMQFLETALYVMWQWWGIKNFVFSLYLGESLQHGPEG